MENKHFFLLGLYVLPFIAAVVMPGWRSLGMIAATCLLCGLWLYFIKENETGGMALVMEKVVLWIAFWGLFAGVIARTITLIMQHYALSNWWVAVVYILGAVLLPLVVITLN